jgi:hypothetical protein
VAGIASAQGGKRPLSLDDLGKIKEVRDPQCAPDGKTVAFVELQIDVREIQGGQRTRLDHRHRRQLRTTDHVEHRQRGVAAVQPGREVSGLHFVAPG